MVNDDMGASALPTGLSQQAAEPASRLGPAGFDPLRCKLERYDKISSRVVDEQGIVRAIVEQLTNGRWIITVDGVRHGKWSYLSAKRAFIAWRDSEYFAQ